MDALDDLYNVGGSGPSNHLVAGLATATNGDTVTFDLSCRVLVDGREYQGGGLVLADAESSNAFTREYIAATKDPNTTAPWRILEYGGTADGHDVKASVSNSGTVRLEPSRTAANPNGAQAGTALAYLDGGRTLSVTVRGAWNSQGPAVYTGLPVHDENSPFWVNPNQPMVVGQSYPAYLAGNPNGRTAVAIGFFHSLDFGDAKNTYPTAGAMLNTAWTGAEIPAGSTITTAGLTPATLDLKRNGFILGSRVDQDRFAFTTPQPDGTVPTGHLDGTNDDRDASDDEDALDQVVTRPGTNGRVEGFIRGADGIHTFIATPGEIFSLGGQPIPVSTDGTHPATVRGWIDWDHNGTFDPDEASQPVQVSAGATTVNLSWTVPAQATSTPHQAYSYTRLPIARDGDEATAGGLSRTGEVEDYRHRIVVLPRTARPAATVDAKDTNQTTPAASYLEPNADLSGLTFSLKDQAGNPATTVTIDGQGTYTIDPATGEIVFTPEPTFTGRTHGVRMVGITVDGTVTAPARYEPVVNASATPPAEAPSSMPTITIAPTPGPVPTLPNTGSSIPFGLAGLAAGLLVAGTAILAARRRAA